MCFHAALVLLHRPSLTGSGEGAEMAKQQCHNSAAAITRLLQVYQDLYNDKRIDVMVVHAAFTAALVHMVLLLSPDGTTYRSSVRSLRLTVRALARMIPVSNYAKTVYGELQRLAAQWNTSALLIRPHFGRPRAHFNRRLVARKSSHFEMGYDT